MTAANRASYVADTIAEIVSQTSGPLSDETIHGFIRSAPLIDADILRYGRQIGSTDLPALVNIAVSSIAYSKANPACAANCTYLAATVFSRALAGPARPCGPLLSVPDDAATTPLTLPVSTFGPVSLVVVDVEVFFKPLFAQRAAAPDQVPQVRLFPAAPGRADQRGHELSRLLGENMSRHDPSRAPRPPRGCPGPSAPCGAELAGRSGAAPSRSCSASWRCRSSASLGWRSITGSSFPPAPSARRGGCRRPLRERRRQGPGPAIGRQRRRDGGGLRGGEIARRGPVQRPCGAGDPVRPRR